MKSVKRLLVGLCLCTFCCTAYYNQAQAAPPEQWAKTAYSYETDNNSLTQTLRDFARSFGLQVQFSGRFETTVSGKFRSKSATAFIERLALEYRFQWFVFNNTLYISKADDHSVERVKINQLTAGSLKKALTAVGLLDERFGWGELPGDSVVLISGPEKYVGFVRSLAKGKHDKDDKSQVLAYKLRHASVADRTIRYRDKTITIPGVATVLTQVLSGKKAKLGSGKAGGGDSENKQSKTKAAGLEAIDQFQNMLGGGGASKKQMVTSDVRNNMILISDTPDKRGRYQAIIDKLDVPLQLMEISAVIIDVNRDRLRELGFNWLFADTAEPIANGSALVVKQLGDFLMRLKALQNRGEVSITASPSVMTQENHPAVIDLSQSVYQTATGERVAEFNKVTAGTSLQVIPRAVKQNERQVIELVVDIEDGKLLPSLNNDLVVQTSNISTQALIQDGHALVLGGFSLNRKEAQNSEVPLLADLPVLGELFKQDIKGSSHQQRLFILIPRLIADDRPSDLPRQREKLIAKSVSNQSIINAFKQLAKGFIPAGFKPQDIPQKTLCEGLRDNVDFRKGQWLEGDQFNLAIGLVNPSPGPETLNPAQCEGNGVLAVTFWPPQPLAPGQPAEILVALRKEKHREATR